MLPVKVIAKSCAHCCLLTLINCRRKPGTSRVDCRAAARRIVTLLQGRLPLRADAQRTALHLIFGGISVGKRVVNEQSVRDSSAIVSYQA